MANTYVNFAEEAQLKLLNLLTGPEEQSVWTLQQSADGVELHYNQAETGPVSMYRISGPMSASLEHVVHNILWAMENAKALSSTLTVVELIEAVTDDIQVIYHLHGGMPWGVSKRDFVFVRSRKQVGDNEWLISSLSIDHPSKPATDDPVRGEFFSGYLVRKNEDGSVHVTYVIRTDLKGYIPSFVMNMGSSKLIDKFKALRQFAERS